MGFNLFPSLFDRPASIRFAYQEKDEYIELFLRQHWIVNVPWIIVTVLGIILPFFFPLAAPFIEEIFGFELTEQIRIVILALWFMFLTAYVIEKFLSWYFNIYIVTNQHVVDIDFHNLLSRHTTEVRLQDIQSPRAHIQGILGSLFNFGNVHIETAAKSQQIDFLSIPKPDFVVDRIQDLQEGRN